VAVAVQSVIVVLVTMMNKFKACRELRVYIM